MNRTTKIAACASALLLAGTAYAADQELTIVSWGGAYSTSQQRAYHDPYMAKNPDVKIVNDDSSPEAVARLRAMSEVDNTTWDVVDVVVSDAIRLCDEGLAIEYEPNELLAPAPDGMTAREDFGDFVDLSPCFIPLIVYSTTFGYRSDLLPEKPTSINDVFDLDRFPGKRSLERRPINNVEWALIADGVSPDKIYEVLDTEEGKQRAFAKLDTIKDQVIWWETGAQTPQLLADGEVVMGSTYNGRLFSLIEEEKQPVEMLWDWQIFDFDGFIIPAGTPNMEAAKEYVRFATDTQRLADQAKYISYGPARKSSAPLVSKHADLGIDMKPHMPTDPANSKTTLLYDYEWWADNRDDMDERFQAWLQQ